LDQQEAAAGLGVWSGVLWCRLPVVPVPDPDKDALSVGGKPESYRRRACIQRPARRLPVNPAEACTALVTSADAIRSAGPASPSRCHSHSTCLVCSRAQGTAVGSAPSSRNVRNAQLPSSAVAGKVVPRGSVPITASSSLVGVAR